MKAILAATLLGATLAARPGYAIADERTCPIEQVVAVVRSVAGDAMKTHVKRAHPEGEKNERQDTSQPDDIHAASDMCIRYGDRLEAGPEAVVTIETTTGKRHIGGSYDPVFQAPQASEAVSPGAMTYIASLYHDLYHDLFKQERPHCLRNRASDGRLP